MPCLYAQNFPLPKPKQSFWSAKNEINEIHCHRYFKSLEISPQYNDTPRNIVSKSLKSLKDENFRIRTTDICTPGQQCLDKLKILKN